jgi:putative FmdB family regulatory protein
MPIHEYVCASCRVEFEELVRGDEEVRCPHCDSPRAEKKLSTFALARASGGSREAAPPPSFGPGACGTCGDPRGPGSCAS